MKLFLGRHWAKLIMLLSLSIMLGVMVFSANGESPIWDEEAHIGAGYSYITKGDYRLNPEHPPLIKDIAAFPLLFLNLNYPDQLWSDGLNNQWEIGHKFLFNYGNDPDLMLFWSRLPIMILSVMFGYLVFRWSRELYGDKAASLAVVLYAFDANIIAHSRYVTTDLGIAFAFFLHLYILWKFLLSPTWKYFAYAGLTFGVVLVTKFSAALLVPIYGLLFLFFVFKNQKIKAKVALFANMASGSLVKRGATYALSLLSIAVIGLIAMYFFYLPHTLNMTEQQQKALISENVYSNPAPLNSLANISTPLAQYFLGFKMVSSHVTTGHQSFLMGEVASGFREYYIVAFFIKTPIPVILLFFSTLFLLFAKKFKNTNPRDDFFLLVPVAVFLVMAILGSINLGIRYLLPIFPFLFIFSSKIINLIDFKEFWKNTKSLQKLLTAQSLGAVTIFVLIGWHIISSISTYPHYLTYFNGFVGGPKGGINYLADSNLDWGQDLKRLKSFVDENNIEHINIDYYGNGDIEYYFGDKGDVWKGENGLPPKGWFALSASYYSQALSTKREDGPNAKPSNPAYAEAFKDLKPDAIIGNSILVYNINK